jgi:hypothetical protein
MKRKNYYIIGGVLVSALIYLCWKKYDNKNSSILDVFSKDKSSVATFPIEEEEILKPESTFEK